MKKKSFEVGKIGLVNRESLEKEIKSLEPKHIICLADGQDNLIGHLNLADLSSKLNINCTFIIDNNENLSKLLNSYENLLIFQIGKNQTSPLDDLWFIMFDMTEKNITGTFNFEKLSSVEKFYNLEKDFKPKNILLTGGAGFIGSHVAIHLVKTYKEYNVIVLDILDTCANLKNLDEIKHESNFKFIQGDICNFDLVKDIMQEYRIDCVMHFAALSHVDLSIKNFLKFTDVNIKGTHVLLENAFQFNVKRFIHVSTDEVYGSTDEIARADQEINPTNPYACSKMAAECIIMAYQKCFKMPILITRSNNVYGPHQYLEKVIPKFINRLRLGKKCCIHGDGTHERDFCILPMRSMHLI